MATVNKDFKIKSGLVVEGTTGTINGLDILTKKQADQDYIIGLIGGTATSQNTPDTVVKRDGAGSFEAQEVQAFRFNIGSIGYIEDDSSIEIVNTDGDDINLTADDIRLQAADDVRLIAGHLGSTSGDVVLETSGGKIRLETADTYIGTDANYPDSDRVATQGYVDAAETDAVSTANTYTDGKQTDITAAYESYADQAELDAVATAESYTDGRETAITTAYQTYADQAETDAKAYTDTRETAITTAYQTYADQAETDAKAYTDTRETAITTAYQSYADQAELDAVATANAYTNAEVAALVDSAPELLDTLNELAAAIADNPNYATDAANAVAGRVAKSGDTMTGDLVLPGVPTLTLHAATKGYVDSAESNAISTAALDATDKADAAQEAAVNAAALDATSKANAAREAAELTASGDATTKANAAEQNAKDYADALGTDDVAEGETNLYFTNQRAIDAVGGTIGDQIDLLTTDDIEEGETNLYFLDSRAKTSAADLLTGANLTNITITGTGAGLTITAENGVADSTTDDLVEGATNKYFSDSLALGAISGSNIQPESIDITWMRREEATWTNVTTAGLATCHSASTSEGSMKYLVRVTASVGGTRHSHVTEVLATVDGSNGVAVVEYGTIYTSVAPLATVTVEWNASTSQYDLNVTTANNNSEVMVAATLIADLD